MFCLLTLSFKWKWAASLTKLIAFTEKFSKQSYELGEFLHNCQNVRMVMKIIMKNALHWRSGKTKDKPINTVEIARLKLSMCSSNLLGWGTPVLSPVPSNVMNHVTSPQSTIGPYKPTLNRFWMPKHFILTTEHHKVGFNGKHMLLTVPILDDDWPEISAMTSRVCI